MIDIEYKKLPDWLTEQVRIASGKSKHLDIAEIPRILAHLYDFGIDFGELPIFHTASGIISSSQLRRLQLPSEVKIVISSVYHEFPVRVHQNVVGVLYSRDNSLLSSVHIHNTPEDSERPDIETYLERITILAVARSWGVDIDADGRNVIENKSIRSIGYDDAGEEVKAHCITIRNPASL